MAIKQSNNDIVRNFLSALYDGDGYLHYKQRGRKKQVYLEYCTASDQLARDVQTLLLKMGVLSHIKEKMKYASNTKNRTKRIYYSVFTYGKEALNFLRQVNLKNKKKSMIAKRIIEEYSGNNPNLDTIPNLNKLVRYAIKEARINVKRSKVTCPKLEAYYENRCDFSRGGLEEVIKFIEDNGKINLNVISALNQLRIVANSDVYWDEITEVEEIKPREEWVYDLEIEETH